jgi:hypothetical protein
MNRILITMTLFSFLILTLFGKSFALSNEEATNTLKELIKTEFKILEIKEAPLEGFGEIVSEVGQEKMIIYIHKNLRFVISRSNIGSSNQKKSNS